MESGRLFLGIFMMVLAGLSNTGLLVFSGILNEMRWPCYRITAISCVIMALGLLSVLAAFRMPLPERAALGWLLLRPLFGVGSFVACILAVHAQTPFGDVASLGSVNIVAAAFLGRILLREQVRPAHALALACTLAGVVLVSQPTFLFGAASSTSSTPWLGYSLALLSGLFDAGNFVSSRKSAHIPVHYLMLATAVGAAIMLWVIGSIPALFEDYSIHVLLQNPWQAVLVICIAAVLAVVCTVTAVWGSVLCPAAVSTTVYTSTNMVSGYLSSLLLYGARPSAVTMAGSVLMLGSVLIMVIFRAPSGVEGAAGSGPTEESVDEALADSDDESLVSFVASEFAVRRPHESAVRKRTTAAAARDSSEISTAQPQKIGGA